MDPSQALSSVKLPPHSRIVESRTDYLIVRIPRYAGAHQFAIIWDSSRDEFVLNVMTALSYRDIAARDSILALHFLKGKLASWTGLHEPERIEACRESLQAAADAVLNPIGQRWEILSPATVPMIRIPHGTSVLDASALEPGHPLSVIGKRYQLGGVRHE